MAGLRHQLLELASGQTDLKSVVSSVEAAARTSLENAETILVELDDAYTNNIIDFEAFSVLKRSVVTTLTGMGSSERKLDFDLTLEPGNLDQPTAFAESAVGTTDVPDSAGTTESIDVQPGTLLRGRFYIDVELGKGGMGTVYKGRDVLKLEAQDRNPYIAIKVLNEDIKQRPDAFIGLQREASRQQRLAHPNIATVYDFDRVGGLIFITMELLEGTPLDEYLAKEVIPRGGLSLEEALPIITSLGSALAYAHDSQIIHSDFKPSNCFLTVDKGVKILDFGIARAVRKPGQHDQTLFDGSTLGAMTPSYASCEMLESLGDPHPGDDVYALGCVSYELLTGKHPYNRLPANVAADNKLKPSHVPKLTRAQNRALARAVAFHRNDRTPSADEFVQSLTGTSGVSPKMWRIAAIAGVATVFAVAGILGVSQYRQRQMNDIVNGVVSVDPVVVESALQRIAALDVDERQQILNRPVAKDGITKYFENNIIAQATALDFPGVDETLARARVLYSDSARIEAVAQRAIEEKNRLIGELSETYESLLRSRKLLADPVADDIPDIIERLKKIDPQHGLITDPRLANTYASAADSLISELDFNGASAIIAAGQLLAPLSSALINTQDRLHKEQDVADRRAHVQKLEQKLAPAVAES
jgi:serine/threonine protein kinase